jgi:glycine/D-amino acid oxidase-like deaminating enzyme
MSRSRGTERRARDPLDGVRPTGTRRSWWLREALDLESRELRAATPAVGAGGEPADHDVEIVGGGYTGLWAAWHLTELAPGIRVRLVERDICGGGPSGRNGGFVTGWWDELATLVERYGEAEALRAARAADEAVDAIGAWCEQHGVDAWYRKAGYLQVSAAPAQDGGWRESVELNLRLGVGEEYVELSPDEVAARVRSPVFREGVFMRGAATVQPARLARGLRRVLLERGVEIHEGTHDAGPWDGSRPVVLADGSWARQGVAGSRLVRWSSYVVLTEPIPDRLAELGWTGGEGLTDARFTLHYARTTPDGRIAIGGGGGRAGFGGRIGRTYTDDAPSAARAAIGLRRWFPSLSDVRIEDAWGGPIDISADHLPFVGSLGERVHYGYGYSGNGVGPTWLVGRILAGLALGRSDEFTSLGLVGTRPRRFPPEPFRSLGAAAIREAIVRRELAEEAGRRPAWVVRQLSRLPRRLGYHLGPGD